MLANQHIRGMKKGRGELKNSLNRYEPTNNSSISSQERILMTSETTKTSVYFNIKEDLSS